MKEYARLREPGKIGSMALKNRLVMAPMCTKFGTEYGAVNQRVIDFYVERAKGGVGLIIIENTCVEWPRGKAGNNPIRLDDWQYVQGLNDLAEAVHPYGTKLATQLQHTGRQTNVATCTGGEQLVSASDVPCVPIGGDKPRPLTTQEVEEMVQKFIGAGVRTQAAGFDAVEIHGAHGYLITQFMSPYTNKRTDKYGGSFENRMRFAVEIVEGIKRACGPDFPILFRYSADEFWKEGYALDEGVKIARALEAAGVDALDITAGIYESWPRIFPGLGLQPGLNVPLAREVKKAVNIPVVVVGRLGEDIDLAEKVLEEKDADFISIGRPLFVDADLPRKVLEGRPEDIRPCLACNEACIGHIVFGWHVHCQVNPELGKEREYRISPTQNRRRICIVGGGPAGMQAAIVASKRGHDVTLMERNDRLGGQLIPASVPWFKKPVGRFLSYLEKELAQTDTNVLLNREATAEAIAELQPDLLVLATGALPIYPVGSAGVTAADVLQGKAQVGKDILVIGGGILGCEVAWHLAEQGKNVTILEQQDNIMMDTVVINKMFLEPVLAESGVKVVTGARVVGIERQKAKAAVKNQGEQEFAGDVVLASGYVADSSLEKRIAALGVPVYKAGDCRLVGRRIWGATSDGAWIGYHLEDFLEASRA